MNDKLAQQQFGLDLKLLDETGAKTAEDIHAELLAFALKDAIAAEERAPTMDALQITPKGSDYRIAARDNSLSKEQKVAQLEAFYKNLCSFTDNATAMGHRIVRETLIITNPANEVKHKLDALVRAQRSGQAAGL